MCCCMRLYKLVKKVAAILALLRDAPQWTVPVLLISNQWLIFCLCVAVCVSKLFWNGMESGVRFSNYEARRLYPAFPHQSGRRRERARPVPWFKYLCVAVCASKFSLWKYYTTERDWMYQIPWKYRLDNRPACNSFLSVFGRLKMYLHENAQVLL